MHARERRGGVANPCGAPCGASRQRGAPGFARCPGTKRIDFMVGSHFPDGTQAGGGGGARGGGGGREGGGAAVAGWGGRDMKVSANTTRPSSRTGGSGGRGQPGVGFI